MSCNILFVCGRFDVKGYVTGFGNPQWKKTHGEAGKTAFVITALLSNGATCVGKTVMDEFSFGYAIRVTCLIYRRKIEDFFFLN